MSIKSIIFSAALVGVAALMASASARADVVYNIDAGNAALVSSGGPTPYATATVHLTDATHATVTFSAIDPAGTFNYSFVDGGSASVNVNATSFSFSSAASVVLVQASESGGAPSVDAIGAASVNSVSFDVAVNQHGSFGNASD